MQIIQVCRQIAECAQTKMQLASMLSRFHPNGNNCQILEPTLEIDIADPAQQTERATETSRPRLSCESVDPGPHRSRLFLVVVVIEGVPLNLTSS